MSNDSSLPLPLPPILSSYHNYYLIKAFPPYGLFVGQVVQHRPNAAHGKVHRIKYEDGDEEDLSSMEIEELLRSNGQVQVRAEAKDGWSLSDSKSNIQKFTLSLFTPRICLIYASFASLATPSLVALLLTSSRSLSPA